MLAILPLRGLSEPTCKHERMSWYTWQGGAALGILKMGVVRKGFLEEEALLSSHKLWGRALDGHPNPEGFVPFLSIRGFVEGWQKSD